MSREAMATKPSTKCGLPKPPPPVKPPSIQSKKTEHSTTPIKHTAKVSAIKNQLAPRSLHVPANFERDEPIKTSSPILQKIVNSKLVRAITNSIQESRSQKSPIMVYSHSPLELILISTLTCFSVDSSSSTNCRNLAFLCQRM